MNPPYFVFPAIRSARVVMLFTAFVATIASSYGQPPQPLNLSTRMRVETGDKVGIAGFIITGNETKHVVVRALGPSLAPGLTGVLADPNLEIYDCCGTRIVQNNNWKDDSAQQKLLEADKLAPSNDLESAYDFLALLPGTYTAIERGNNGGSGLALIEIYDLSPSPTAKLSNISTRAFVQTGNNIVIAGFMLGTGTGTERIVIRGLGPSLQNVGLANTLPDPTLEVRNSNGAVMVSNDNWEDDTCRADELSSASLAPNNALEAGTVVAFSPGAYTVLLSDSHEHSGIGLVEVYELGAASNPSVCVKQIQSGTSNAVEKQHVSFSPVQMDGTFRITVRRPSLINHSGISARAALEGQTASIPFTATASDVVNALTAIEKSYYAYDQAGNPELIKGSFSYFASHGAVNREPVVKPDFATTVGAGFTIEFGSVVGKTDTFPGYNTWVANMPLVEISFP